MNNTNPFIRLQQYYYKLQNPCSNITELHEITNIPLSIIRMDFVTLFEWQHELIVTGLPTDKAYMLTPDEDCLDYEDLCNKYNIDILFGTSDDDDSNESIGQENFSKTRLKELFTKGYLDDLDFYIFSPSNGGCALQFNQEEAAAIQTLRNSGTNFSRELKSFRQNHLLPYLVKDNYMFLQQYDAGGLSLHQKLETINNAISNKEQLKIIYKDNRDRLLKFDFQPLKISYDASENLYAVLSIYENKVWVHRLDQILSISKSDKPFEEVDMSLFDITPNVWGNSYQDTCIHVKVNFFDPEIGVFEKVKRDLHGRTNGKFTETASVLCYEDDVYGLGKFESWLRSYGSSVQVLEPKELRQSMIASLIKRKERG